MKDINYDNEELELLEAFEAGTLQRVEGIEAHLQKHRIAAEATFKKDQRLNIRITSRDLKSLQAMALAEGIPYQTFAASLIHKYANGQLELKHL